ncbi:MAG: hypothetical protein LBR86_08705 [Tannerella sp.]|nr:hypothetical protein [Tannerella sp.]
MNKEILIYKRTLRNLTVSQNVQTFGKNICRIILCSLFMPSIAVAQPEWMKKYDYREVREMFNDPPMFYAPHTFWFWDDVIKDEHAAASMVEEMAKQKLNPGYAHPRSGFHESVTALPVEQYLAAPWFNSFGNALQKAKDKGLTLGYCDEYNWPSGHAAGKVLAQHPELEARYLSPKRYYVSGKTERYLHGMLTDFSNIPDFWSMKLRSQ